MKIAELVPAREPIEVIGMNLYRNGTEISYRSLIDLDNQGDVSWIDAETLFIFYRLCREKGMQSSRIVAEEKE